MGGGLFHNTVDQGLVKVTSSLTLAITKGNSPWSDATGGVWGDFDNDGLPDLFVPQGWNLARTPNALFHNTGGGNFTKVSTGPIATDLNIAFGGSWGDYDGDGWLDLFVPGESTVGGSKGTAVKSFLYRNKGDGTFERITTGLIAEFEGFANAATWGDFNNDGRLDLYLSSSGNRSGMYLNHGAGDFERIDVSMSAAPDGASFGDINNDGNFELIVANPYSAVGLFTMDGGSVGFAEIPDSDNRRATGCAWGDYDNDGWLDLFVPHTSAFNQQGDDSNDALYHNNGDGTFTRLGRGSFSFDGQINDSAAWGDYNNDGFLDLFVAAINAKSGFYKNNGNTNKWLAFNLKPTLSNRSAIGAKVRVKATIAGKAFWQVRQVSGGEGWCSQNDPRPHFGLGDSARAEEVRVEWPSGKITTLTGVPANQFVTIIEPDGKLHVEFYWPWQKSALNFARVIVKGEPLTSFALEKSSSLLTWTEVVRGTLPSEGESTVDLGSPDRETASAAFYRAVPLP
jgi:hypothetical protein